MESDSNPAATLFVLLLDPALIALTTLLIVFAHSLPQAYVVGGAFVFFALAIIYLMGGMKLTVSLASFIYPAYMSLQCIESKPDAAEEKQWLTYWVIYSLFGILEGAMGFVMNLIPYYSFFKIAMFMYLFHPQTEGATMVYDKFIAKYLVPMIKSPKVAGKKE